METYTTYIGKSSGPGFSRSGEAQEAVLRTLCYFDLFQYPLTRKEVQHFLPEHFDPDHTRLALDELVCRQQIFLFDGFYSLANDPARVQRRRDGNERAVRLLEKARRIGRFLHQFPFVEAIAVSGSLSKNFADPDADIDFFIITKANRLWTARTLMHLYKKFTFITGRQHYHCMNYYIDEEAFLLQEQNIFTAVEIKTLLPVCGEEATQAFFSANKWADDWLPCCDYRLQRSKDPKRSWLKRLGEWMLRGSMGQRLESFFFRTSTRRWKRKQEQGLRNNKGLRMGLVSHPHYAKSDPGDFQQKILSLYAERVKALLQKNEEQPVIVSSAK